MEIDQDIQKIIDDYIIQIQDKEEEVLEFKKKIDKVISNSQKEFEIIIKNLDEKFDAGKLNEEEYLLEFRSGKDNIIKNTKEKLDYLIKNLN